MYDILWCFREQIYRDRACGECRRALGATVNESED